MICVSISNKYEFSRSVHLKKACNTDNWVVMRTLSIQAVVSRDHFPLKGFPGKVADFESEGR